MCTKEVKIDMEGNNDGLKNLQRRLSELPGQPEQSLPITIPRLPNDIIGSNQTYYEPQLVSIGPYYHGMKRYRDMEQHKLRFLRDFLSRHQVGLEVLVNEMRALEAQARQCYSGFIGLDGERFAEMLLLDGCFILKVWSKLLDDEHDAILDILWAFIRIHTDLLLIENQIPFFVIHKLYSICHIRLLSESQCRSNILNQAASFVYERAPMFVWPRQTETLSPPQGEIHHLLHFYEKFHVPNKKTQIPNSSGRTMQSSLVRRFFCHLKLFFTREVEHSPEQKVAQEVVNTPVPISSDRTQSSLVRRFFWHLKSFFTREVKQEGVLYEVPSATDLSGAGVVFRKKQNPDHFLDITFKNGILEMPTVGIDRALKSVILNLIAWTEIPLVASELPNESDNSSDLYPVKSYATLLGSLLRASKDVQILKAADIILNDDPSDEELAKFFNHLEDLAVIDPDKSHYFSDLFSDVKRYYDSSWHRYMAKLWHDYFQSPWSIISLVAAIILLLFSGTQTSFAIYRFAHQ